MADAMIEAALGNRSQLKLENHNEEDFNPQGATTEDHRHRDVSNLGVLAVLRAHW
jgi:hypothetical protein